MYTDITYPLQKEEFYRVLYSQIKLYTEGETDGTAVMANASAVIKIAFPEANWVGFYVKDGSGKNELKLGPFQGRPAVTRIPCGEGVCGSAWARDESIVVEEVACFEGHIACDCSTHSEIVIPLRKNGEFYGVLDMDSITPGYFTEEDRLGLESCAELFLR